MNNSTQIAVQRLQIESAFGDGKTVQRQIAEKEGEESLRGKFDPLARDTVQTQPAPPPNNAGLPDNLKSGIELLSGIDIGDVRVQRNSSKPAQLNALAYTQGNEIHLGPGQERHLPHEAWHAVQQKQGRVKPTNHANGAAINDDPGLEREATVMGAKSLQRRHKEEADRLAQHPLQQQIVQRKVGLEFQAYDSAYFHNGLGRPGSANANKKEVGRGGGFTVEGDGGKVADELEIQTNAVDETDAGREQMVTIMNNIRTFLAETEGHLNEDGNVDVSTLSEGGFGKTKPGAIYLHIKPDRGLVFHPQATVGVRLESLGSLMAALASAPFREPEALEPEALVDERLLTPEMRQQARTIGWSQEASQKPFRDMTRRAYHSAQEALNPIPGEAAPSHKLQSFVFLVSTFIEANRQEMLPGIDLSYAKYLMPFMSRSDLSQIYNNVLNEIEREQFHWILEAWDLQGIDNPPFHQSEETVGMQDISTKMWLEQLGRSDLVAMAVAQYGAISGPKLEYDVLSAYDIGIDDQTEERRRRGILIELRKLGADVGVDDLPDFALAVFNLVRLSHQAVPSEGSQLIDEVGPAGGAEPAGVAAQNEGGCCSGCFITTACTRARDLPDDCEELETLRAFRDDYIIPMEMGPELIQVYYRHSPKIVAAIEARQDAAEVYARLYAVIQQCVRQIQRGDHNAAFQTYVNMVIQLRDRFTPEVEMPQFFYDHFKPEVQPGFMLP